LEEGTLKAPLPLDFVKRLFDHLPTTPPQ
jgi:hypothetical protein